MSRTKKPITDAVALMDRWYGGTPEWDEAVAEEELSLQIGLAVHDLRGSAGLTQKQLAGLIGTSQSVVSRVEHADYEGSALEIFKRVCFALHKKVQVRHTTRQSRSRPRADDCSVVAA